MHKEPLLTRQFALLLVTTAVIGLSFSTYFLLPKYLAVELGADAGTIGGVSAVTMIASVLGLPLAGVQIDRRGRRPFACMGALIFAVASLGFVMIDRVGPLLWVVRIAQGLAWPLYYLALSTLATDLAPKARMGEAIGLFGAVMISTNALGPALAEAGARAFGWPAVFGATVVAAVAAAVLSRFLHDPPRPPAREAATTVRALVLRPGLRRVLLATVLVGWTFSAPFTFYQPWALANGFEQVSLFLVAFSACAMFVRVALGGIADRFGRLRLARYVLLLYTVAPLTLIWLPTLGLALTGSLLGISHGIVFPTLNAVAVEFTAESERGKAMGAYNAAFNVGFAAGSYILGYVAMATSFPTIFVIATLTCAAACILLVFTAEAAAAQAA